ncbi:MAG: hypothetical protein Q8R18_00480 [bacterium]|nr:hypothetical protein [bacterium]
MRGIFLTILFFMYVLQITLADTPDPYAPQFNFTYITSIYKTNPVYTNISTPFAKGDAILIEARMYGTDPSAAIPYYKQALDRTNVEEQAILFETIASLENNPSYYWASYVRWKFMRNNFRANIDYHLLNRKLIPYQYEDYPLKEIYFATPKNATTLTIGESSFTLTKKDILVSQVDRVTRDWLSSQLQDPNAKTILTIFSEKYDVEDIGWHEGGRIAQYKQAINLTHISVTGTIVRKINNNWYAPNEQGIFMFDVPLDKVQYPTTRFLREDLALIIDTHGINMLVEQAIEQNATVVMGCCDHIGKIKAALYLNERGIKVICNTDKYLPLALGQTNETLGSAPFKKQENTLLFGAQPIKINLSEKIIVLNATEYYGLSYYATSTIYFTQLQKQTLLPLDLVFVTIDDYNQLQKLVDKAEEANATVIAARVYNEDDYVVLSEWLESSEKKRIILFHSEAYPYGYLLLRNYPAQVTFDDIMPSFS